MTLLSELLGSWTAILALFVIVFMVAMAIFFILMGVKLSKK